MILFRVRDEAGSLTTKALMPAGTGHDDEDLLAPPRNWPPPHLALRCRALTLAGPASASTASQPPPAPRAPSGYQFRTLNDARDLTFNQLLGINNEGVIAGYFGSGAKGHPNKGYQLFPAYGQGNYLNENFPGSRQTQVTGLNDLGVTVGFWSTQNNASMVNNNFGFYSVERPVTTP